MVLRKSSRIKQRPLPCRFVSGIGGRDEAIQERFLKRKEIKFLLRNYDGIREPGPFSQIFAEESWIAL
jgi:hypothetical protein